MNAKLISGRYNLLSFKLLNRGDIFKLDNEVYMKYDDKTALNMLSNNLRGIKPTETCTKLEGSILLFS